MPWSLYPGESVPSSHRRGEWVGPWANLNTLEKGKTIATTRNGTTIPQLPSPACSLVALPTPRLAAFSSALKRILFNYAWKIQYAHLIFKSPQQVMERRIIWSKCQCFIHMLLEHKAIFNLFSRAQELTTTTNSNSKPFVCFSIWFIQL